MKPLTLLYIEDDRDIQSIYMDFLQEQVAHVEVAFDGEEGYALYLKIKPDILLLDINMPKLDGLSLAKKIRQTDTNVKIIVTTSYADQEKLLEAIELYLVKYLLKPIDFSKLEDSINKAISEIRTDEKKREKIAKSEEEIFSLNENIIWYKDTEKLYNDSNEVKLTKNERRLLALFSTKPHKIFTFFEIFNYISYDNYEKEYDANQVRALVKLLRKKIPKESVLNVYGEGYRFNPLEKVN